MDSPLPLLHWSDSLSLGIPELDRERIAFLEMINSLNRALLTRASQSEVNHIVLQLIENTEHHFEHEQQLFEQYHYPYLDQHTRVHDEIRQQLHGIAEQFANSGFDREWIALGLEFGRLLITHLQEEDMQYKTFLAHAHLPQQTD